MKVDVYGIDGKTTGKSVDLPDDIFGIEPNEHAVYLDVKSIQANARQGTHKAKERGEIKGSTRKIKKQKGTGTARAGSIKSGVFRGGGRIFGPKPHAYSVGLNKKVKRIARMSALSAKVQEGTLKVVEDFSFEAPKTKAFLDVMRNLEVNNKPLIVLPEFDNNVFLSSRNIQKANVMVAKNLNTLDIMKANSLVLSVGAIEKIKETFTNK
ncbi:MAG: 50S ribosomal protein L4 [Saprospiraceae bacterium]|nr:50S ribosomal protein L4 [Bacteroidia bacterium]NNE16039.1 50S ribosomal protein L4 [Saprospiraceae bacterium]NNL90733.1 50S ribosomal protein L4 [Saprospiraceae bacterium]